MNLKTLLPLIAIAVFIIGFLVCISPFCFAGGVVGIFTGCKGGEVREYFFGHNLGKHIFEDFWSLILGIVLMGGASIFGMTFGLIVGIDASASEGRKVVNARNDLSLTDDTPSGPKDIE